MRSGGVHPGAWWLWALSLAFAASRTTNPLLLGLIIAVAAFVVAARRPATPWSRSFIVFLRLGGIVLLIRVGFAVIVGALQGTLTLSTLLAAGYDGLRLATILACIGAANSLASPTRLLKSAPAALYEFGVALVVSVTFAPQLVADLDRVRTARRLRGRTSRGLRGAAAAALPVIEGALERSVTLAAAMDSRGYGRAAGRSTSSRRITAGLLLGALVAVLIGAYAVLDASAPAFLGLPALAIGGGLAIIGLALAGRRTTRTRYRPDAWGPAEWGITATAAATTIGMALASLAGSLDTFPPAWPTVPPLAAVAIALSLLPAWCTPAPSTRTPAAALPRERVAA